LCQGVPTETKNARERTAQCHSGRWPAHHW
jgi:hypothetical protein